MMTVLSLFDGMSCGQLALNKAGLDVDTYIASEIDRFAMSVTQHNFPDTVQIGSVTDIHTWTLPDGIDLLIGGSPCQGFSFAGKQKGAATKCDIEITTLDQYLQLKEDGFEFHGQSYLFWEYMRILKEVKPKYFLLENVRMSKKWQAVLSEAIGCEPIVINSALVSAQNRVRLYWTNIPGVTQPEDRGILLKDILATDYIGEDVKDTDRNKRHYREDDKKALCCTATMYKGAGNNGMTLVPNIERPCTPRKTDGNALCKHVADATDINGHDSLKRVYSADGKVYGFKATETCAIMSDAEWMAHKDSLAVLTVEENILAIKQKVGELILKAYPDWFQRNMIARRMELKEIVSPTQAETDELALIDSRWAWVKAMRAKSGLEEIAGTAVNLIDWNTVGDAP